MKAHAFRSVVRVVGGVHVFASIAFPIASGATLPTRCAPAMAQEACGDVVSGPLPHWSAWGRPLHPRIVSVEPPMGKARVSCGSVGGAVLGTGTVDAVWLETGLSLGPSAVHLVAGSITSPVLAQIARSELARPLANASVERFSRANHVFHLHTFAVEHFTPTFWMHQKRLWKRLLWCTGP